MLVHEDRDFWPYVRDTRVQILVSGTCSSAYRKNSLLVTVSFSLQAYNFVVRSVVSILVD